MNEWKEQWQTLGSSPSGGEAAAEPDRWRAELVRVRRQQRANRWILGGLLGLGLGIVAIESWEVWTQPAQPGAWFDVVIGLAIAAYSAGAFWGVERRLRRERETALAAPLEWVRALIRSHNADLAGLRGRRAIVASVLFVGLVLGWLGMDARYGAGGPFAVFLAVVFAVVVAVVWLAEAMRVARLRTELVQLEDLLDDLETVAETGAS